MQPVPPYGILSIQAYRIRCEVEVRRYAYLGSIQSLTGLKPRGPGLHTICHLFSRRTGSNTTCGVAAALQTWSLLETGTSVSQIRVDCIIMIIKSLMMLLSTCHRKVKGEHFGNLVDPERISASMRKAEKPDTMRLHALITWRSTSATDSPGQGRRSMDNPTVCQDACVSQCG